VTTWYTIEEAREDWPGAPLDDEQLQLLLDVSRGECVAFAPVPVTEPPTADIPDGHRWAHLAHARNIWNAQKANPSGGFGDDTQGFALTPFPMDWAVRARLRPRVVFGGDVG
jgi:hypothetical protein